MRHCNKQTTVTRVSLHLLISCLWMQIFQPCAYRFKMGVVGLFHSQCLPSKLIWKLKILFFHHRQGSIVTERIRRWSVLLCSCPDFTFNILHRYFNFYMVTLNNSLSSCALSTEVFNESLANAWSKTVLVTGDLNKLCNSSAYHDIM